MADPSERTGKMKTSQYDSKTRHAVKRDLRAPETVAILEAGRGQRAELEAKLAERKVEIAALRKVIEGQIANGAWNSEWTKLGFSKPD
jgi:hypothetical protein